MVTHLPLCEPVTVPREPLTIRRVSTHATARYRERVDPWTPDTVASVVADLTHPDATVRDRPPRWLRRRPARHRGAAFVLVPGQGRTRLRCYVIRDSVVVTVLIKPAASGRRRRRSDPTPDE